MSYLVMESWATEDVASIAPDLNERQQCAVLLLACVAEHNAELGVNWDVLKEWAEYVRQNPDVVDRVHENHGGHLRQGDV